MEMPTDIEVIGPNFLENFLTQKISPKTVRSFSWGYGLHTKPVAWRL